MYEKASIRNPLTTCLLPVCSDWGSAAAGPGRCSRRCRLKPAERRGRRSHGGCRRTPSDRESVPSTSRAHWTTPSHLERRRGRGRWKEGEESIHLQTASCRLAVLIREIRFLHILLTSWSSSWVKRAGLFELTDGLLKGLNYRKRIDDKSRKIGKCSFVAGPL